MDPGARHRGETVDYQNVERPIRRPSRWPVYPGVAGLLVGWLLPWASSPDRIFFWDSSVISADTKSDDGTVAIFLGILLLGLVASRRIAISRTRLVQLAPAIVGAAILFMILPSLQWTVSSVDSAVANGWVASIEPGVPIEFAAAVLCVIGGVATTIDTVRSVPAPAEAGSSAALDRDFLASILVGAAGAVLGVVVALGISALFGGGPDGLLTPVLLIFLVLLGPAVAVITWRRWLRPGTRTR